MTEAPGDWHSYIPDDERAGAMRLFGLSDRIRYYWARPRVASAVQRLFANIDAARPEIGLLAQYAPHERAAGAAPSLPLTTRIISHHVGAVVAKYRRATGTD